ncbi:MAG TPA: asparagine synthase-related protein [Pyrinomonadaceae bacterium]
MSAIGGIYAFNGAPVNEQQLVALGNCLDARGPDGGETITFRSLGMVHRAFHTNKESRNDKQPFLSPNKQVLVWDGRLDNRDELTSKLKDISNDHTDVALVMAAYRKWEDHFLSYLIGDFTLSLWEPYNGTLLLARDPIGPRTLYYHLNARRIIWSTELRPLLDISQADRAINDEYIADYLMRLPDPADTPYKEICAVPPGHAVLVHECQVKVRRFWGLNPDNVIRYRSDGEYEEHFRHLFREAVRCRLRVEGTAWAELSGGLDSSAIVCMADEIVRSGEAEASGLQTISNVFDEASTCDERRYISHVETKVGRRGHYLREDDFRIFAPLKNGYGRNIPNPITNFADYYARVNELMAGSGARVLLSGKGGDEILFTALDPTPELADLFAQHKLIELHRRINIWRRALEKSYVSVLWNRAVLPVMPDRIRAFSRKVHEANFFNLYNPTFAKRMNLYERRLGPKDCYGHPLPSGNDQAKWFLRIVRELSAGYWREFGNVEITYPFTHLPLVEFMHATPFEQRVRVSETRSLLRRALRNLLPVEITERRDKGLNTEAALHGLRREWPRLNAIFADPLVCTLGYVDRDGLNKRLALAREGKDVSALSLAFLIPLEHWLQAEYGSG